MRNFKPFIEWVKWLSLSVESQSSVKRQSYEKKTNLTIGVDRIQLRHIGKRKNGMKSGTMREMETPFIIAGKGIQRGRKFQECMMQFHIAPTIADIFHLEQPQVWVGRSMKQVFIDDI